MGEEAAQRTRDDILRVALHLFTVQGYDATSLRQIADRLGFTKAALYYHFPAKEHLAIELARPWLEAVSNLVTLHRPDESSAMDLISDYVDLLCAHHAVMRFLSMDPAALKHPDVGQRARALVKALEAALAGPEADDTHLVRVACALWSVHAINGLDAEMVPTARPIVIAAAKTLLQRDIEELAAP